MDYSSEKKIKIFFTVTNDLNGDRRMIRICTSLESVGYDVTLIGRKLRNSTALIQQPFRQQRMYLFFTKGKLFYIEYNIHLFFKLFFSSFDIICGIDLDSILPCYFAARLKGKKKLVYDAHELFTDTPEVYKRKTIRKIWLMVEKFIIPKTDLRYTVSQSIADEFENRYGFKFELIRNLPSIDNKRWTIDDGNTKNIDFLKSKIQNPKSKIVYLGNLNEGRGVEIAIEALKFLNDDVHLWIIGDGNLRPVLEAQVGISRDLSGHQLSERVKFFGFIPPNQLPVILSQAKIGLHVLESKGLSYEYSLANKFFDYIQAGLPSVFTNLKEHKQLNDTYNIGIMIENADAKETADAVNLLLNDKKLYQTLHENCLKAATILCWENEEKELVRLYEQLSAITILPPGEKKMFAHPTNQQNDQLTKNDFYIENGLYVFTEAFLLKRGYCCGNGCRHCPYQKMND